MANELVVHFVRFCAVDVIQVALEHVEDAGKINPATDTKIEDASQSPLFDKIDKKPHLARVDRAFERWVNFFLPLYRLKIRKLLNRIADVGQGVDEGHTIPPLQI
ncbi:MAG: hypothetical protein HYV34_01945 [Candidatus Kerfeldbacteria bacterium]|nr:hypothetical protein [Candidatus Kerfeldbacteria bacterium]